jgi:hypothetical protein
MNEIPTPAKFRESALIETYFPLLKQIIKLGQAAETILDHRTTYRPFLSEAEQLVRDFPSLCEAGNEDQMQARFRSVIYCIQAAQLKAEQSTVN